MSKRVTLALLTLLAAAALGACNSALGGGNYVWIDVPVDGLVIPPGQPINIQGHASAISGMARVEIWLNGDLLASVEELPIEGNLASLSYQWMPPSEGEYLIQLIGFDSEGGASQPDTARVIVRTASATPVPTSTSTPTPTLVGASVLFWAEPAEIVAGGCSTIRWQAEGVQSVVFGGVEQEFESSYSDCFCQDERFRLIVTHLDGSEEQFVVDILVDGECTVPADEEATATPTPVPGSGADTTAPPAPVLEVPGDGLTLSCRATQTLAWQPASDPSGIAGYDVQVERHSGDNNWQPNAGSPYATSNKTIDVSVECGWYYRWRVRATDGAGNVGDWTGWRYFTITLT